MKNILLLLFLGLTSLYAVGAINYKMIVSQDGTGDYKSIQEAINATKSFPPKPITIYIKNGIYNEKVRIYSWNTDLNIIGESADSTIITYNDYFDKINLGRNSTFHTYTVKVECNNFAMKNLTVENTAGKVGQAVALHVEGDKCIFENIRMIGNQDVLYAAGAYSRQYYTNCYIEGTTDFIFGNATALFENCTIHSKSNSYITAASTPQNVPFGYVFKNCTLTADDNITKVYLGRPWRKYAKTVFIECELGKHIKPEGWKEWSNKENLNTTFYAEFNNYGAGATIKNRIPWSHQLKKCEAKKYTFNKIFYTKKIQNNWILLK